MKNNNLENSNVYLVGSGLASLASAVYDLFNTGMNDPNVLLIAIKAIFR